MTTANADRTRTAESSLPRGQRSSLSLAWAMGNEVGRQIMKDAWNSLSPQVLNPVEMVSTAVDWAGKSLDLSLLALPGEEGRLARTAVQNKIEVYQLVRYAPSILKMYAGSKPSLPEMLKNSYALDAFEALWAVEGTGHYWTETLLNRGASLHGFLEGVTPRKSLLMMHAGLGLAFGDHCLKAIGRRHTDREIRKTVERFIALCRANSRRGYLGAALESLGLVARDLYPWLVRPIDTQLSEIEPGLLGFYWHGVGRGIAFSWSNFLSDWPWKAVQQEAPHGVAKRSAMSGASWVLTLVNMCEPKILEQVLRRHGGMISTNDSFTNGLVSSLIMRQDTTPDAPFIQAFCKHEPREDTAAIWNRLVREPCRWGLEKHYPELKHRSSLDALFQYEPMLRRSR